MCLLEAKVLAIDTQGTALRFDLIVLNYLKWDVGIVATGVQSAVLGAHASGNWRLLRSRANVTQSHRVSFMVPRFFLGAL